jgi:hypothetical protein
MSKFTTFLHLGDITAACIIEAKDFYGAATLALREHKENIGNWVGPLFMETDNFRIWILEGYDDNELVVIKVE